MELELFFFNNSNQLTEIDTVNIWAWKLERNTFHGLKLTPTDESKCVNIIFLDFFEEGKLTH